MHIVYIPGILNSASLCHPLILAIFKEGKFHTTWDRSPNLIIFPQSATLIFNTRIQGSEIERPEHSHKPSGTMEHAEYEIMESRRIDLTCALRR
jgi:hypothetical protein